jgi:hypothetical protein
MELPDPWAVRFEESVWLAALWGILCIVLLYFLRRRAARILVPHLPLWEDVLARMRRRPRWIRVLLSLLLQVLVYAAIVLALAHPVTVETTPGRGHTIVVLDRSLGTLAKDEDGLPLSEAVLLRGRSLMSEAIASGPVSLAFLGGGLRARVTATEDEVRLMEGLMDPGAPSGGRPLETLLQLRRVVGDASRIAWVTPFDPGEADAADLAAAGITVVGTGGLDTNAGIVGVERRESAEVLVRVRGEGPARKLQLTRDGRVLAEVAVTPSSAGTQIPLPLPPDAGAYPDLVLDPPDGFPLDDRVPLALPERERIRVLVVADSPTPYVDAFLEASVVLDRKGSHRVGSRQFREWVGDYDAVIIVDDATDLPLPPGRYLLLGSYAPDLPVQRAQGGIEGPAEPVRIRKADPLVRGLDLDAWRIQAVSPTRSTAALDVIVEGSTGPLLSRAVTDRYRLIHLAVRPDTAASALPRLSAFPLLLEAALVELAGPTGDVAPPALPAGGTLDLLTGEEPLLMTPQGATLPPLREEPDGGGYVLPERPGRYRVGSRDEARTIGIGLLDHPGRPGSNAAPPGALAAFPSVSRTRSWRASLIWVLLVVLGLEWLLYQTRITA